MATAAPDLMEDHITCNVCLETYTRPHQLKCLHTYCYDCIQRLKHGSRIQCPDRSEFTNISDINKKGVKMQNVIDINQMKNVPNPHISKGTVCDACDKVENTVESVCTSCSELLCGDCSEVHQSLKVTEGHKLISFSELDESNKRQLDEQIQKFIAKQVDIQKKQTGIREVVDNIRQAGVAQVADVNTCRKYIKDKADEHHDHLIEEINFVNGNILDKLEESDALFEADKNKIGDKINFLTDICQSSDFSLVRDTLMDLSQTIESELSQMKSDLCEFNPDVKSPVSVEKGEDWDPQKSTRIKVSGRACEKRLDTQGTSLRSGSSFVRQRNKEIHEIYRQVQSIDLPCRPRKLCVTEELWVAGGKQGLYRCDESGEEFERIKHDQLKCVSGIVETSMGDLIVGDRFTGLHHLNQQGQYLNLIRTGHFSDVSVLGDTLYALEHVEGVMCVFKKTDTNSWVKDTQFQLHYSNMSDCDTLGVSSTTLYVCPCTSHCVYEYSQSGEYRCKTGARGQGEIGKFQYPHLSDVDSVGRVLLCGCFNDRLLVFDPVERIWSDLILLEVVGELWCAAVGQKDIWVGTRNKLLKYEKVDE